jgi:hypothetical protein
MLYLPNIYQPISGKGVKYKFTVDGKTVTPSVHKKTINIGCFGAVRVLKNHLQQAVAAIRYADENDLKLNFFVNCNDTLDSNNSIIKNLVSLFEMHPERYMLCKCKWVPHDAFMQLVKMMDLGMQVSLSESFDIVAADFVASGVPLVVSNEISWMPSWCRCNADVDEIVGKMNLVMRGKKANLQQINKRYLSSYNKKATAKWLDYLIEGRR